MNGKKVLVIGLDCADPGLIFDKWRDRLPAFRKLMERGFYGPLESTIPCITVPAWATMTTGKDPGELGFYGFRNRGDYTYDNMKIAMNSAVKAPRVWEILSGLNKKVIIIGVPQTYPVKPVNGVMVGCFLSPHMGEGFAYPDYLGEEIKNRFGDYIVDIPDFRSDDKKGLLKRIYEMTEQHFSLVTDFIRRKPWDFFMFVEIGVDRIHHGFWSYHDPGHYRYHPGNPYESAIFDYYSYLDRQIKKQLDLIDENTIVMVVSDHGAKRMDGGFCINDWLIAEGYLRLKRDPDGPQPFRMEAVDWGKTIAWGSGGYYGRINFNVKGREPDGIVLPEEYDKIKSELIEKIKRLKNDKALLMKNKVYLPGETYRETNNIPPDLIVYFDDLNWRSIGTVGNLSLYTRENDTGPDDANHARHGIYIQYDPSKDYGGRRISGLNIKNVAKTMLYNMGVEHEAMEGEVIRV